MDRLDIHGRQRRLELAVQSVRSSRLISERNKRLILEFCSYCFAEGLSVDRAEHLVCCAEEVL